MNCLVGNNLLRLEDQATEFLKSRVNLSMTSNLKIIVFYILLSLPSVIKNLNLISLLVIN